MDEIKLILHAQKGEEDAFQELISIYYSYVLKFLMKLSCNKEVSEDLTQETFIKVIRSIDTYDVYGKASFSTYVITIARNTYIDYLRKNKNVLVNVDSQGEVVSRVNIEEDVLKDLELVELLKLIDDLSPEQGEAIKLKYLEEFTLKEIAERFKCEPKTIKSRIHNGIVKIRRKINLKGGELNE